MEQVTGGAAQLVLEDREDRASGWAGAAARNARRFDAEGRQRSGTAKLLRAVAGRAGPRGAVRQTLAAEIKLDGYRLQARIEAGRVKLLTRSGLDWTAKFGKDIAAALKALPVGGALIDGELVVENHHGASDFRCCRPTSVKAERRSARSIAPSTSCTWTVTICARRRYVIRKQALERLLTSDPGGLRWSGSGLLDQDSRSRSFLRHACRLSLEGMISKLLCATALTVLAAAKAG